MNATWEPSTDSVTAPARCAMNRSQSGGIALSRSETRYQLGNDFQPATVAFSVRAAALSGRFWLPAIRRRVSITVLPARRLQIRDRFDHPDVLIGDETKLR